MGQRRLQHHEMRQKTNLRDAFFGLRSEPQDRPVSVTTEFVDTDWDEEFMSEAEDDSPRHSLQSVSGLSDVSGLFYFSIPFFSGPRISETDLGFIVGRPTQYYHPLIIR